MIVTNNEDFYQYLQNRGVVCLYAPKPNIKYPDGIICIVFTNNYHSLSVCGNRFQDNKKEEFVCEANELMDWFDCCNKVIMISNVIKLGTPYMRENFELLQQRYDKLGITKQVIHTKDIGSLLVPHYVQLRYKGIDVIDFDIVATNKYLEGFKTWRDNNNSQIVRSQQIHYFNVLNATHDTETRRKLRYIPEYSLFSQIYKKLCL